jgi:hypothetical protein
VSALGDLLERIHTASHERSGVIGTYRHWRNERLLGRLEEESDIWFGSDFENRRTSRGHVEVSTSFWFDPRGRVRLERRDPDGNLTLLVAVDGARRGVFTAGWGAELEDHHPEDLAWVLGPLARLLDPAPLLGPLELSSPTSTVLAGRRTLVAKGMPRDEPLLWPFGPADDYELLVDEGRGLLVKLVGFADGEEAIVHELANLNVDARFTGEEFAFDPPGPQEVSGLGLREASRLATFSAWALPIPVVDITHRAEFAPTSSPESLTLSYSDVTLLEMPATASYSFTSFEEPSRIERSGRTYLSLPGQLMFQADDTFIVMSASPDVSASKLVDWAESLTKLE